MDWLERELVTEKDNQSTLECLLEKLAEYCTMVQNDFENVEDWKLVSPKIRYLLKTYGGCIRNKLQDPSVMDDNLLAPFHQALWKMYQLAKYFWNREVNIGIVCWTVLVEILKTVPLSTLEESLLEQLCVTILQLVGDAFENCKSMSQHSSFSKLSLFISKLLQQLTDLSLGTFLQPDMLPHLLDTWRQAVVEVDDKENLVQGVCRMANDLNQIVAASLFETPKLFGKVWLDTLDTVHSKENCFLLSGETKKNRIFFVYALSLLSIVGSKDCKLLLKSTDKSHLITSLVLILEYALSISSPSRAIEYLFLHITGNDALVRLLCMDVWKHVVRRNKIPIANLHELQRKLNEIISLAQLFDCKAVLVRMALLRKECFETSLLSNSPSLTEEPSMSLQRMSCRDLMTTDFAVDWNNPRERDSHQIRQLFQSYDGSVYETYCLLSLFRSRKLSLAETSALIQPVMNCGAKWDQLIVIVCEWLSSAITSYPELTTNDSQLISFITSNFGKLTAEYRHSEKPYLVWLDAQCFLALMKLATTFCRYAPESCVQRLGKDTFLANCLQSTLFQKSVVDISIDEIQQLERCCLHTTANKDSTTLDDTVDAMARRRTTFTRLLLSTILEWIESHQDACVERVWNKVRQSMDAVLLKTSRNEEKEMDRYGGR